MFINLSQCYTYGLFTETLGLFSGVDGPDERFRTERVVHPRTRHR